MACGPIARDACRRQHASRLRQHFCVGLYDRPTSRRPASRWLRRLFAPSQVKEWADKPHLPHWAAWPSDSLWAMLQGVPPAHRWLLFAIALCEAIWTAKLVARAAHALFASNASFKTQLVPTPNHFGGACTVTTISSACVCKFGFALEVVCLLVLCFFGVQRAETRYLVFFFSNRVHPHGTSACSGRGTGGQEVGSKHTNKLNIPPPPSPQISKSGVPIL